MSKLAVVFLFFGVNCMYAMEPGKIKIELLGQRDSLVALITAAYANIDVICMRLLQHSDDPDDLSLCLLVEGALHERMARLNSLCEQLERSRPVECSSESIGLRCALQELGKWRSAVAHQLSLAYGSGAATAEIPPLCFGDWHVLEPQVVRLEKKSSICAVCDSLTKHYQIALERAHELGSVDGRVNWCLVDGRVFKWISY